MCHWLNILYQNPKIAKVLEKSVFKVVTSVDIPNNARISNSFFSDKVNHASINKAYENSRLVI